MTEHKSVVYVINRLSVVVDNDNLFTFFVELTAFKRTLQVRVNYDKKRLLGKSRKSGFRRDEYIGVKLFISILNKLFCH